MREGKIQRTLVRIVPFLAAWLIRIWFATCKAEVQGSDSREKVIDKKHSIIAAFWHYSLVYVFYHLRDDSAAVLVSASEDGDYIAGLAQQLNFGTVRGSRNRRGLRALKELIDRLQRGEHIGIVADGSQGPPLVLQPGAILMASRTGSPILPMAWSASKYIAFKSWDRTAIPLPFSRVRYYYGEPFYVPSGIGGDEIEHYRQQLEEQMNTLYHQAWSFYGKEYH